MKNLRRFKKQNEMKEIMVSNLEKYKTRGQTSKHQYHIQEYLEGNQLSEDVKKWNDY